MKLFESIGRNLDRLLSSNSDNNVVDITGERLVAAYRHINRTNAVLCKLINVRTANFRDGFSRRLVILPENCRYKITISGEDYYSFVPCTLKVEHIFANKIKGVYVNFYHKVNLGNWEYSLKKKSIQLQEMDITDKVEIYNSSDKVIGYNLEAYKFNDVDVVKDIFNQ